MDEFSDPIKIIMPVELLGHDEDEIDQNRGGYNAHINSEKWVVFEQPRAQSMNEYPELKGDRKDDQTKVDVNNQHGCSDR